MTLRDKSWLQSGSEALVCKAVSELIAAGVLVQLRVLVAVGVLGRWVPKVSWCDSHLSTVRFRDIPQIDAMTSARVRSKQS